MAVDTKFKDQHNMEWSQTSKDNKVQVQEVKRPPLTSCSLHIKVKDTTKNEVLMSQKQAWTKLKNMREDSSDEEEWTRLEWRVNLLTNTSRLQGF